MNKDNDRTADQGFACDVKTKIDLWGKRDRVAEVIDAIKGQDKGPDGTVPAIDFGRLLPVPEDVDYFDELHPGARRDWLAENWGCVTNALDAEIMEWDGKKATVSFLTKWEAPAGFLEEFAALCEEHSVACTGCYSSEIEGMVAGLIDMRGPLPADYESVLAHEIGNRLWKEGE